MALSPAEKQRAYRARRRGDLSAVPSPQDEAGPVARALELTLALMLANACGGFLYLAIHAVLGEIFKHHKALVLGFFAAGFGLIAGLILYFHISV